MSLFDEFLREVDDNIDKRKDGKSLAIPWPNLEKLSNVIPGIQNARYYMVTANSKVGKTQLADFMFVYEPLEWLRNNPDTNLKLKIFYFPLETSVKDKIAHAASHYLYIKTKRIIPPQDLLSLFKNRILTDEERALLDSIREEMNFFEQHVQFVPGVKNPYGIYKEIREYARANGRFDMVVREEMNSRGQMEKHEIPIRYHPNDPDEIVLIVVDHLALITPEAGKDLRTGMQEFSTKYCLTIRDLFGYSPVIIQQQAADSEKPQYTVTGKSIVQKLKPSTDGLGDNKAIQRDVDVMFGLFAPARYEIWDYAEYNIRLMNDHYRELLIILNRRGGGNIADDLFFHGGVGIFRELPSAKDPQIDSVYETIRAFPVTGKR